MLFKTTLGLSRNTLKFKYPEYYLTITEFVQEKDISLSEIIWLYQNKLKNIPICNNTHCSEHVKFIKFSKGYRKYCSRRCAAIQTHKNEETKTKRLNGFKMCNNNKEIRQMMTYKSNLTKSNQTEKVKYLINLKREKTNLKKWGVDNISKNEEIKIKISKRLKEVLPAKRNKKSIDRITKMNFEIEYMDNENLKLICGVCNKTFDISRSLFNQRNKFNIDICLNCNPKNGKSNFETKVHELIISLYKGECISQHRDDKYEIDIYLPELKIGFECNGLWWHSERYKENDYHIKKTNHFKEKGIHIIHIWEDDWNYKSDIISSRISNIIGETKKIIYARNCNIREISSKVLSEFLKNNHIQGKANSKIKIGLLHKGILVSVMSFGSYRINLGRKKKEGCYELLRFCNLKNHSVVGGASKLLKYFKVKYSPSEIISYASKDWSNGNLYKKLGFKLEKSTQPNYYYFHKDDGIRLNRFTFRKDKLVKEGFDKNLTEHIIMNKRGYYRVYDTGSLLYVLRDKLCFNK